MTTSTPSATARLPWKTNLHRLYSYVNLFIGWRGPVAQRGLEFENAAVLLDETDHHSPLTERIERRYAKGALGHQCESHPMDNCPAQEETARSRKTIIKHFFASSISMIVIRRRRNAKRSSQNDMELSSGRCALQTSIAALDIAFSIAGTVPVVGQPLKDALEALCKVLKLVEQRHQNAEGLPKLAKRLTALIERLSEVEIPDRDVARLIEQLQGVERQLRCLLPKKRMRYTAIAQILADCHSDVNDCIQDFMASTQVELLTAVRIHAECITFIDPFGATQRIPRMNVGSIEMVASIILDSYHYNPRMQEALRSFVRGGMYEMIMDDGQQIETVRGVLHSTIGKGSTVVMNVVIVLHIEEREPVRCPMCHGIIPASQEDRAVCTGCDRRVSAVKVVELPSTAGQQTDSSTGSELTLFRHITIHEALVSLQKGEANAQQGDEGHDRGKGSHTHPQDIEHDSYDFARHTNFVRSYSLPAQSPSHMASLKVEMKQKRPYQSVPLYSIAGSTFQGQEGAANHYYQGGAGYNGAHEGPVDHHYLGGACAVYDRGHGTRPQDIKLDHDNSMLDPDEFSSGYHGHIANGGGHVNYTHHPQDTLYEPDVFSKYNNQRTAYRQDPGSYRATRPPPAPNHQPPPMTTTPYPFVNLWQHYAEPPLSQASSTFAIEQDSYDGRYDPEYQDPPFDSGYGSGTSYTSVRNRMNERNPFYRLMLEDQRREIHYPVAYAQ